MACNGQFVCSLVKLARAKSDLGAASRAIDTMRNTSSFSEFRENWENFLFRAERAWESTQKTIQNEKGFGPWYRPYAKLRKKDPLLVYLRQARHAEMHSVSPTMDRPLKLAVVDKSGRGFTVNSIAAQLEKGVLTIDIDSPDISVDIEAKLIPTDAMAIRFKNRNKWYNPPWMHLDVRIVDLHPVSLAELGLSFYRTFVEEAEYKFCNS